MMRVFVILVAAAVALWGAAQSAHQHHPPRSAEEYARALNDPARDGWQKPHEVIQMVDSNVLFQDSVQLLEKLIQEGRQFGQAFYPEENHAFVRDESIIDAFRRTADWMDRYLR